MKQLLIIPVLLFLFGSTYAQDVLVYADMFHFNGKPKQVKLYYQHPNDSNKAPDQYWLIEYDYSIPERVIRKFREHSSRNGTYVPFMGETRQSLLADDMAMEYINTFRPYGHTIYKDRITYPEDGSIWISGVTGERKLEKGKDGRVIRETRYYKEEVSYTTNYTYSNNGKTVKADILKEDGTLQATHTITYDEHANPVHVKGYQNSDDSKTINLTSNMYTYETTYTYDEYGNFTKCEQIVDGNFQNPTIVREIAY